MINRIAGLAHRLLPVRATNFVRCVIPNSWKIQLRGKLTAGMKTGSETVTSADGRIFQTIEDALFFRVFYEGVYEPQLTTVIETFIRSGDTILDVGANFGWYATLFGKQASAGTVIAYEPVPDTFEVLRKNIQLNGLDEIVQPYRCCVGTTEGSIPFVRTGNSGLGHVAVNTNRSGETLDTPMVTLDSHASEWIGRVALLKVHVEGFELEVLRGASNLLAADVQPVVQIKLTDDRLKRYGVHRDDITKLLKSHELRLYELSKKNVLVLTERPVSHEIFGVGRGAYADRFRELFG